MSALNAALRFVERGENEARPFLLNVTMQYGRKIRGTVGNATAKQARDDGGVGIQLWDKSGETSQLVFVTGSHVLWCEVEWLDGGD